MIRKTIGRCVEEGGSQVAMGESVIERSQKLLAFMPQPKWWHRSVSWLLWLANSDAQNWRQHRFAFYSLKDQILEDHAVEDGLDWQRFEKDCWGCYGTGYYTHYSGDKDICHRCYGSGVYATYYVKLHRLRFGGRVFHRPGESQNHAPETDDREVIAGRIRHKRKGWPSVVAFAVLLVMFNRATSNHPITNA